MEREGYYNRNGWRIESREVIWDIGMKVLKKI